jgi:hypothetical protein
MKDDTMLRDPRDSRTQKRRRGLQRACWAAALSDGPLGRAAGLLLACLGCCGIGWLDVLAGHPPKQPRSRPTEIERELYRVFFYSKLVFKTISNHFEVWSKTLNKLNPMHQHECKQKKCFYTI